jgi:hypothetical protein
MSTRKCEAGPSLARRDDAMAGLAAGYLPARRASHIDPALTLRSD